MTRPSPRLFVRGEKLLLFLRTNGETTDSEELSGFAFLRRAVSAQGGRILDSGRADERLPRSDGILSSCRSAKGFGSHMHVRTVRMKRSYRPLTSCPTGLRIYMKVRPEGPSCPMSPKNVIPYRRSSTHSPSLASYASAPTRLMGLSAPSTSKARGASPLSLASLVSCRLKTSSGSIANPCFFISQCGSPQTRAPYRLF